MYFRHERLYKTESLTAGKEWSEKLPRGGILDHLLVSIRTLNTNTQYGRPEPMIWDHITNIALKDGGKNPFYDVWGQTAMYQYAMATKETPPGFPDCKAGNYQLQSFPMLFGRKPKDGKYGLNLAKLSSPQIFIDNDFTSDDYSTTLTMDIDAWFLEEAPAPAKLFRTVEWDSITFDANSQFKKVTVPDTEKVRQIFLGSESARTSWDGDPGAKANKSPRYLKYMYNTGSKIVRDDDLFRNDQDMSFGYPDRMTTQILGETLDDIRVDSQLCRPIGVSLMPSYSSGGSTQTEIKADPRGERFVRLRAVTIDNEQLRGIFTGYGYMDHQRIKEYIEDTEDEYLDPKARKDVEIEVGNHSSGGQGTVRFITQSLALN